MRADLPDWLWLRLAAAHGEAEALRIAQAMLNPAPLDLRVNLARTDREAVLERLARDGIAAAPTPYSPAGMRLAGKPAINRHALFRDGLVEVQDEGSQLLAWLLAPRRGEMVADYCAGAGGKTLALAMLMRGAGRIYAIDVSAKRLARARAARGARRHQQRASDRARPATTTRAPGAWPARSTACWSTRRAAASARCGAIPTSSGATARRRSTSWRQSSRASSPPRRGW